MNTAGPVSRGVYTAVTPSGVVVHGSGTRVVGVPGHGADPCGTTWYGSGSANYYQIQSNTAKYSERAISWSNSAISWSNSAILSQIRPFLVKFGQSCHSWASPVTVGPVLSVLGPVLSVLGPVLSVLGQWCQSRGFSGIQKSWFFGYPKVVVFRVFIGPGFDSFDTSL